MVLEGYGRVQDLDYSAWKTDPDPNVLTLGTFRHPTSGNQLLAGINLNYLTKRQVDRLRYYLPEILKERNLYVRYWTGARLLPDIFKSFYRYYRTDKITGAKGTTLKFLTPDELEQMGDVERAQKLQKRREQLKDIRAAKKVRKKIVPSMRPVVEPAIPAEVEPELPPEPGEPDTAERAAQAVDRKLGQKMSQRIDARTRELEVPEPEPEPLEPEELEPEPEPEVPEEPIEEPEEPEEPEV